MTYETTEVPHAQPSDITRSAEGLPPSIILPDPSEKPESSVLTTIYRFPDMAPITFTHYPSQYLDLPLRKDLLHKAVVYEGDKTRSGTANTKWRLEVRGSGKKLMQQKGSGKARVGDKKSPIRRGGGVVFGPKPRDFSTELPKKMYDIAWRTALSFRWRRGELILVDAIRNLEDRFPSFIRQVFERNGWGNVHKRSLLITRERTAENNKLFGGMKLAGEQGRLLELEDVDVKDLLETGRVIIEWQALNRMLKQHSSDLTSPVKLWVPPSQAESSEAQDIA